MSLGEGASETETERETEGEAGSEKDPAVVLKFVFGTSLKL